MVRAFRIEPAMIKRGLKGNDLVLYAFLFNETKGGREKYYGNHMDMAGVLNTTIPTVYNVLRNLEGNGLIRRTGSKESGIEVVKID